MSTRIARIAALLSLLVLHESQAAQPLLRRVPSPGSTAPLDQQTIDPRNQNLQARRGELDCLITDITHLVGTAVRLRCFEASNGVQFIEMPVDRQGAALIMQALSAAALEGRTTRIVFEQAITNPRCSSVNACASFIGTR
jgi:hypothetical protein